MLQLINESEKASLKGLALRDFYFFAKDVLGYDLLNGAHERWCDDLLLNCNRNLLLKPRGTYKSTVYTVAYPLWKAVKYPDSAILITNAVAEKAAGFLFEIKGHIERGEMFRWLFGDFCINAQRWITDSIILNTRRRNRKEGNIDSTGALSQITSAHYDTIICDDIVNNDDRESPTHREKKKRWFKDLMSILSPDGELIVVGTRWHFDDLYHEIIDEINPKLPLKHQYHIEIEKALDKEGNPTFPEILSLEQLDILRIEKGAIEFNSQYLNDPLPAGSQIFHQDRMHFMDIDDVELSKCKLYGSIDPSMGKTKHSDFSVIPTLAKMPDGRFFVLECDIKRRQPDQIIADMIAIAVRYEELGKKFKKIIVETNQFQQYFKDQLVKQAREQGVYLPIVERHNSSPKPSRIKSLQPMVVNGTIVFRNDWRKAYPKLIEQLIYYCDPPVTHDDAPDALEMAFSAGARARIPRLL